MNEEYDIRTYKFPHLVKKEWKEVFPDAEPLLLQLLNKIMVFSPSDRATAMELLACDYFDELRDQLTYSHISSMYHLRDFYNFSKD